MGTDHSTGAPFPVLPIRKPLRVSGVHATPGGWVHLIELEDGWVVFADNRAGYHRWQGACALALIPVLGTLALLEHGSGPVDAEAALGFAAFGLVMLIMSIGDGADRRASADRRRTRAQSTWLAGGRGAVQQAVRRTSGARTVAEMNVLLTSLGRTEPVYSIARTRHTEIKQHWWQCTVRMDLAGGHQLVYRARGIRRPTKLAQIFRRN
ncbi:MAG TPA: hypothetical protein VH333_21320 [Pseudonocardiaceae bacterium]|jgi:hypothetical protein|nr:hypothetical protein [Pseudonocardiaceae bacterium]